MASYYCSITQGNDTYNGTSELLPFKTPRKLSLALGDGDRGYLKRGDTWRAITDNLASGSSSAPFLLTVPFASSEANRIIVDAYGTGDLPTLDAEKHAYMSGSTVTGVMRNWNGIAMVGSFGTLRNIRVKNAGPEIGYSTGGGSGGGSAVYGMSGITTPDTQATTVEYCEVISAYRSGIQSTRSLTAVSPYISTVKGCYVTDVCRTQLDNWNWPAAITFIRQLIPTDWDSDGVHLKLIQDCIVEKGYGEGITGGARGTWGARTTNCEVFAVRAVQFYVDTARDVQMDRNISYGTTNPAFHRGSGGTRQFWTDAEQWEPAGSLRSKGHGYIDYFLNLAAFGDMGFMFSSGHADSVMRGYKFHHNTSVDCQNQYSRGAIATVGTGNEGRNNISMPISSGKNHKTGTAISGMFSQNYWYTGSTAAPTDGWSGAGDRKSATPILEKMTGWTTLTALGAVTPQNFAPTSRAATTAIGYTADFFGDVVTMDEFGAIKYGSTEPDPGTAKWRYFEVRAVNASGAGPWSARLYAATETS